MNEQLITVEVAYALPTRQSLLEIHVAAGTDIKTCIEQSGILEQYPEIDLKKNKVGIWSRTCKLTDTVKHKDRIEIYRPLIADPKEIRRRRAEKAKEEGRANKITGGRAK
ncbi:RnfH family protein [Gayadomonas joobiniege]|uniref:RnfH family protein n=1 Tax=Gayadomonas joobiniege TaxID=1234606 RepID=UPI000361617A|nr:RnfH family protein [Gayadomonas joobiniege]